MPSGAFGSLQPAYRSWDNYLRLLTNPLASYLDDNLSRYSEYRTYTHDMQVMMRMIRDKWKMNVGVMFQPQHSTYMQDYLGVHVDTARTVFNWSPTSTSVISSASRAICVSIIRVRSLNLR